MNNLRTTKKRLKDEFEKKYPNAHVSRFSLNVVLSKTGDVTGTSVSFKIREEQFLDITTKTFKELYSGELYWKPRIWGTGGTVQPFVISTNMLSYNVRKFTIFVNARSGYSSNFEALETSWKGTADDITKMAVDPYFASLAACIISHVCGISRKHLNGDNKVITSIARFYLYYHMKTFTDDPRKMSPYITNNIKELIKKIYPLNAFGLPNSFIHEQILIIGIHTIHTNTIFEITSTE